MQLHSDHDILDQDRACTDQYTDIAAPTDWQPALYQYCKNIQHMWTEDY